MNSRGVKLGKLIDNRRTRAWRVVLDAGFLRVCPIQPHFLRRICLATGSCPARSHSSSFRIFSGYRMLKMCLRQNGNFEGGQNHWDCWSISCSADGASKHSGRLGLHVSGRAWRVVLDAGFLRVSGWIKLLNGNHGYTVDMELGFEMSGGGDQYVTAATHSNARPSDGWIHLTGSFTAPNQDESVVPVGPLLSTWYKYNANAAHGKYRDFIHKHFTWAVPENALKWPSIEPTRGHTNYQPALDFINGVRHHGLKVRGHNLVWSVDRWVQDWVKQLHGDELRNVVKHHIDETMAKTCNLVEHWDVNNENLHGQFYQNQLHDPDYDLELFRMAHAACQRVKLFLNDYNVVSNSYSTNDYLQQARRVKAANVGLNAWTLSRRAGLPIWATELDVQSNDENKRADYYENALTALYGHPSVEGILIWGFWDQAHWRGEAASLVKGNKPRRRRVLDLWENRWKTDETHNLSHGDRFTVRGFHGKYEVHVMYQGHEKSKQTFTLGKGSHDVNIHVQ
nr:hypothetical protein BaRGS_026274 [Batillaria attramentaria]